MSVVDASAVVEILLSTPLGLRTFARAQAAGLGMHAPHVMDVEVAHVLRRLAMLGQIAMTVGGFAITTLAQLRIQRHGHLPLLPRIWELRGSLSAYDASYVALAEMLDMPLLTCDAELSRSHGHRAKIELLA